LLSTLWQSSPWSSWMASSRPVTPPWQIWNPEWIFWFVPIWWRRTSGVEELCPTNLNHHNGAFIVAREGHFCGGFFWCYIRYRDLLHVGTVFVVKWDCTYVTYAMVDKLRKKCWIWCREMLRNYVENVKTQKNVTFGKKMYHRWEFLYHSRLIPSYNTIQRE
jgi:hypothetical protein